MILFVARMLFSIIVGAIIAGPHIGWWPIWSTFTFLVTYTVARGEES
jgi:hypothetical protein